MADLHRRLDDSLARQLHEIHWAAERAKADIDSGRSWGRHLFRTLMADLNAIGDAR